MTAISSKNECQFFQNGYVGVIRQARPQDGSKLACRNRNQTKSGTTDGALMKRTELVLGLLIVISGVGLFVLTRRTAEQTQPARPQPARLTATASEVPLPTISFAHDRTNAAAPPVPRLAQAPLPQAQNNQPANSGNDLEDPDARDALALVGVDAAADVYWLDAIFDPTLPDNERADLMEDLNEVGFDDPKNLTADDLPMILSRLELIDAILPSVDPFMSPHLLEAQKDLSNMLATATSAQ
jgi:hypothetical protein